MPEISKSGARKVALVTGAGRGIGRQIAVTLTEHGYRLGLVDRSPAELAATAELVERAGGQVIAVTGDVAAPADVERACAAVQERFGAVDVLVNNAGDFGRFCSSAEMGPDLWWQVMETNMRGPMLFCHQIIPSMLGRGRGFVVNVNSRVATKDDPNAPCSAYAASKAALSRFTGALAQEVSGTGVVVLDFSPGMVRTAMTRQRPDYDELPDEIFLPATSPAETIAELVSGRYDALHGRFVHVRDDLEKLTEQVRNDPAARVLAVRSVGPHDPLG